MKEYQITLKVPKEIKANNDIDIAFNIANMKGNSITDLEPLMGAGGHTVIISSNAQEFLHVHPVQEVPANWKGGPIYILKSTFQYQAYIRFGDNFNIRIKQLLQIL